MATVAVLGCGLLGAGVAERQLALGMRVRVWNRTAGRVDALVARGAEAAPTPAAACAGVDRVHLVLTADDAVDAVLDAAALPAGTLVFDHSTNLPERVERRIERLAHLRYVPAPVFMSPANARDAQGMILVGGTEAEVEPLLPVLTPMTGKVWRVGDRPVLANVHKLMGNAVLIAVGGLMGDVFAIGARSGLDPAGCLQLFEQFRLGPYFVTAGQRVARAGEAPASFTLDMARKDVRLMIEAAGGPAGLSVLPGVEAAMGAAVAAGHGGDDFGIYARPSAQKTT